MKRHVADWMSRTLLHAAPTDPLFRGLEMMAEQGVRHILILDDGRLQGILSNRDVIRSTTRNKEGRLDLHGCTLAEVMTPLPLQTIRPDETIGDAAERMHHNRINALPVLDADGTVRGVITSDDVMAAVSLREHTRRPDV